MADILLKIGKGVDEVKQSVKAEVEKTKPQPQAQPAQTQVQKQPQAQPKPEEKLPETEVKDQYDANDEIYYEKENGKKNIAIFVKYSDTDDEHVLLKPTPDTKDADGNPSTEEFAVNKANVIGAVVKNKVQTQVQEPKKSKAAEAAQNLVDEKLNNILSFKRFKSI